MCFAVERGVYAASPFGWRGRQNILSLAQVRTLKRRLRRAPIVLDFHTCGYGTRATRKNLGAVAFVPRTKLALVVVRLLAKTLQTVKLDEASKLKPCPGAGPHVKLTVWLLTRMEVSRNAYGLSKTMNSGR